MAKGDKKTKWLCEVLTAATVEGALGYGHNSGAAVIGAVTVQGDELRKCLKLLNGHDYESSTLKVAKTCKWARECECYSSSVLLTSS